MRPLNYTHTPPLPPLTPRQTKLYMKKYFLESAEFITGSIEGEFGNDKGVFGNASIRLYAHSTIFSGSGGGVGGPNSAPYLPPPPQWSLVSTLDLEVFDGGYDFELPMEDVIRAIGGASTGAMIRVEVRGRGGGGAILGL